MTTHVAPHMITYTPVPVQKTLPHIDSLPLLGNLLDLTKDPLAFFRRVARTADVCGIRFGPFPHILFNQPQHAQSILLEHAQDFDKGAAIHKVLRRAVGDGLFSSEGAFHHRQRKLLTPPFQPRHIAHYAGIMGEYSEQIQGSWSDSAVIDIKQEMTTLTMNIIGKVLFDFALHDETTKLGSAAATIAEYLAHVFLRPFSLPYSWPTPRNRRAHQAIQVGRDYMQRLIDERRHNLVELNDFLSILLQARDEEGQSMTDEQLMAECLTLFVAGYETTATALTWTWYLLCQHPDEYQKVQEEVDTILQGRTPTYDDLAHLPYCLQVFKESLRLYPPAHVLSRRALRTVDIDGYCVPQGWSVLVVPYLLHRREDFFPEPEKFDPTRFTPQREKQLPRYAYLPFGAGPRICIGLHFAMMEGHLLLANMAQRSRFSLLPGQNIKPDPLHNLILRPSGPVNMLRKKR